MAIEQRNTVTFDEVFHFAEKTRGVLWNKCNDLFFRSEILKYGGYTNFDIEEVRGDIEFADSSESSKYKIVYEIILAFMVENKVDSLMILNG